MKRTRTKAAGSGDEPKLPPHSESAERGVLACLILDSDNPEGQRGEALEECMRRKLTPAHFYCLTHQLVYAAILRLAETNRPADLLLLSQEMKVDGAIEQVGGVGWLSELADASPSAANISYYLDIVVEKFGLRHTIQVCSRAITQAYQHEGPVTQFIASFETDAMQLGEAHVPTEFAPISDSVGAYIDSIEMRHRGKQEITGLATPFWYLNNITCGIQPREYLVLGARPSVGKTAVALDIIRHAVKAGNAVLFFSLEMAKQEILGRLVAAEAKVDGLKLRNGFWTNAKQEAIANAAGSLSSWKHFLIDDRSFVTGQDVFIAARRAQRQHDIRLVVVDYIQLMHSVRQYSTRAEEIGEASGWLKRTAKELGVPVLACAQLSRESEKDRGGKPPLMSDLRECGKIEADADVIAMLYEPRLDDSDFDDMKWLAHHQPDDPKEDSEWHTADVRTLTKGSKSVQVNMGWRTELRRINMLIAKNRNGQTGPCELVNQKRSTRFVDAHSPKRVKEDRGTIL